MARQPETPEDREARIQRILRQMEQQLRQQLPDPQQTLGINSTDFASVPYRDTTSELANRPSWVDSARRKVRG